MNTYKQLISLLLMFTAITFSSCNKEEAHIVPGEEGFFVSRFTFPQGYHESDEIIEKIYNNYGVRIVYKELDSIDFFGSWVAPSSPDPKRVYNIEFLTRDTLFKMVNFLENKFFKYLPKDIAKKTFPNYIYVTNDFKNLWILTPTVILPTYIPFEKTTLRDYWIMGPPAGIYVDRNYISDDPARGNSSPNAYLKQLIYDFLGRANKFNLVDAPEGLDDQSDFSTISAEDIQKVNVGTISPADYIYGQRGVLPALWIGSFDTAKPSFSKKPASLSVYPAALTNYKAYNFSSIVQNILYRTPEAFRAKFGKYDKIMYQYNLVVKHFKDNYNMDLEQISRDLEIKVDEL